MEAGGAVSVMSRRAWCFVLVGCLACCDGEDPEADAGVDAGVEIGTDAGVHEGAAYLLVSRVRDPDGRRIYLTALETLDEATLDFDTAIEVPGVSRAFESDGFVFAMNAESLEIVRYRLGAGPSLVPDERLSMAAEVSSFRSSFAFISPTRAYYLDPVELRVIVWNPQAMELVGSFDVPSLERAGFSVSAGELHVVDDRVLAPIAWDDPIAGNPSPRVATLILSAEREEVLGIAESETCALTGGSFVDGEGDLYVLGDNASGAYTVFRPELGLPSPCILRLPRGADAFDDTFSIDMRAVTGAAVDGVAGTDRVVVTRVFDDSVDPSTLVDAREYYALEAWSWHRVDLDTRTAENLGLPLSGISFRPLLVDEELLIYQLDEETQRSTLYRVGTSGAPMPSVASPGELQHVGRIQ